MRNFEAIEKCKKGGKKKFEKKDTRKQLQKPSYRKEKAEKPEPKKSSFVETSTKSERKSSSNDADVYGNKSTAFTANHARNNKKTRENSYKENKTIVTRSSAGKSVQKTNIQKSHKKKSSKFVLNQIIQKEEKRYEVSPTFTSAGIPGVWDYNDGKRIRLVTKAGGTKKNAVYINKDATSPFNALIPISRSNLIIDYFAESKRLFVYKVISNSIKAENTQSTSSDVPVLVTPYNSWTEKSGWAVEPFDSIKELLNIIEELSNVKEGAEIKGYYTKKEKVKEGK